MENVPERRTRRRTHERDALARRQSLGFAALILMLTTIVTLAVIRQPWVAGAVAAGLAGVVAIFVTGERGAEPVQGPNRDSLDGSATSSDAELG